MWPSISLVSTSFMVISSRVIARSKVRSPRLMVSVTLVPFSPRTLVTSSWNAAPLTLVPSTAVTRSPAWSPAFSAGEPEMGLTTTRTQVSDSVVQEARSVGLRVLYRHLGADAAELAGEVAQRLLVLVGCHVAAERVADAILEHALDGALGELGVVERVDVLLLEVVICLAEGREGTGRRGTARRAITAGHQVPADEEERADDGGQGEGHDPGGDRRDASRRRRPRRSDRRFGRGGWRRGGNVGGSTMSWRGAGRVYIVLGARPVTGPD